MVARKSVSTERAAQLAAASKRYRARKAAEREGRPTPPEVAPRRLAAYHPPKVSGAVARASATAAFSRSSRAATIESLPSVRNPAVTIYVPREPTRMPAARKTKAGQARQAEAIRERAAAEKLQTIGRSRRFQLEYELFGGQNAERLQDAMTRNEQARFQKASRRIAGIPQQALAILFDYEGGAGDYSSAIERILSSPESRDVEEGLGKLEALADLAERAGQLYSPRAIGRLTV